MKRRSFHAVQLIGGKVQTDTPISSLSPALILPYHQGKKSPVLGNILDRTVLEIMGEYKPGKYTKSVVTVNILNHFFSPNPRVSHLLLLTSLYLAAICKLHVEDILMYLLSPYFKKAEIIYYTTFSNYSEDFLLKEFMRKIVLLLLLRFVYGGESNH